MAATPLASWGLYPPHLSLVAPLPDAPLRICDEDGTHHFSQIKRIAESGTQYLHACNTPFEPTADMRIGTVVHFLILGQRPGAKPIVVWRGKVRNGKEWEAFEAENAHAEIISQKELASAEQIAAAVLRSPVAMARLKGARFEVPLRWEENGLLCSTSGVDILTSSNPADISDLKSTSTTQPDALTRQSFKMSYPQQLAFYRRGARANGINVRGLFLLGVARKAPHEVVELELTEAMIEFADRTLDLWLEKLRVCRLSCPEPRTVNDWPGYAEAPVVWDVPAWAAEEDEDEASEEDAAE